MIATNEMFSLTPELQSVAERYCSEESSEGQINALDKLRLWIRKTQHLKARTDSGLLMSFLRVCRFDVGEAQKRLELFYTMKQAFPEFLMQRKLDESLLNLYRQGIHVIPEKPLTPDGPRLVITQLNICDEKCKSTPREIFKLLFMLAEILANDDPNASVAGVVYILDARDVTPSSIKQYDPCLMKKIWAFVENGLPLRLQELHVIHMRKECQDVLDFLKSFRPSKMPIKFAVHKKAEDLYAHIPREAMTVEYGGHNGYRAEALQHWENIMLNTNYRKYFATDDAYGTNEKLRMAIGASLEVSQLTGLNGSFRKLTFD